jgi:hypothetical protein
MNRTAILVSALVLLLVAPASANRRAVRVDTGALWSEQAIGSAGCPGSATNHTRIMRNGYVFSGRDDPALTVDAFCQVAVAGEFDENSFVFGDEQGLATLVGPNDDNAITAIRYTYLDRPRNQAGAFGFQWAFYYFPHNNVTIAALYGLVDTPLTATSYIQQGSAFHWRGNVQGFDGEYFCYRGLTFLGAWNGDVTSPGSECLIAANRKFRGSFE